MVMAYETSGPCANQEVTIEVRQCVAAQRRCQLAAQGRNDVSQTHHGRTVMVAPEMEYVAMQENLTRELARENAQHHGQSGRNLSAMKSRTDERFFTLN